MPLIFSPVDLTELRNPYSPRPRSAFLMLQLGEAITPPEQMLAAVVRHVLSERGFEAVTASDVRGTTDYLNKIVDLIRGCGFGLAVFSDRTPARTLANIFFEVGVAGVLGKPVQLVFARRNRRSTPAPSDFVRTEWIAYDTGQDDRLRTDLRAAMARIEEGAVFYRKLGQLALEAPETDLELAFERFKQAVLIANDQEARRGIMQLRDRLERAARHRGGGNDILASHRTRLLQTVNEFLRLLPDNQ